MLTTRSLAARIALCATVAGSIAMLSAATPVSRSARFKGGPWISIETPTNPYDSAARGAVFVVHTFHHAVPTTLELEGRAEGLVDGQRRTMPLSLSAARVGTFAVRNVWGTKGTWSVVLIATQPAPRASIQAMVDIGADGAVAHVSMPQRMLTTAEIDRSLRERASAPTRLSGR